MAPRGDRLSLLRNDCCFIPRNQHKYLVRYCHDLNNKSRERNRKKSYLNLEVKLKRCCGGRKVPLTREASSSLPLSFSLHSFLPLDFIRFYEFRVKFCDEIQSCGCETICFSEKITFPKHRI
jgi:hypothetical protein